MIQRPWYRHPGAQIAAVLVIITLLGGGATGLYFSQQAPPQPIQFPHSVHVGMGAPCAYCHPGADSGPVAGLPSTAKCWGCHQQIAQDSPELEKLATFALSGQEIPWVPVFIQPDFVQFNHRPHIAAQVECKTCHGDLSKVTVAEPIARQNMGWCLSCHKQMAPQDFTRLSDCALCHY